MFASPARGESWSRRRLRPPPRTQLPQRVVASSDSSCVSSIDLLIVAAATAQKAALARGGLWQVNDRDPITAVQPKWFELDRTVMERIQVVRIGIPGEQPGESDASLATRATT